MNSKYFSWAQIGKLCVYGVAGTLLYSLSNAVGSKYLDEFFESQLLQVEFTLLGINVATASILFKAIAELPDVKSTHFAGLRTQVKFSIYEQIVLIAVSLLLLTLKTAPIVAEGWPQFNNYSGMLLTGIIAYELEIIRDLFKAMTTIIQLSMQIRDNQNSKK
jgi:hypothetical protein